MYKEEMLERVNDFTADLEDAERATNTIKKYERVVRSFINSLPSGREITKKDIIQWKKNLTETKAVKTKHGLERYNPSSVNDYIVIVNKYLSYIEHGLERKGNHSELEVNLIRSQNNNTVNNVVSDSDVDRLIKAAYSLGQKDTAMIIQILVYTGIRINELNEFTVENLRHKTQITIHGSKGKTRQVAIPTNLNKKLNRYIQDNQIETGYLFKSVRDPDKPLSDRTIWKRLQKCASIAKVNLKKAHAHSFRHRFTINLSKNGYPAETIADILGHSSTETTRKYLRHSDDELQQIMNSNESRHKRKGNDYETD